MRMTILFLFAAGLIFGQSTPVDCSPASTTFTAATTGASIPNANTATPCVAWRLTYNSTGFSALSIQIETSPDNVTFTPVTNTVCSSSVQPPCVIDGANPSTTTGNGTLSVRAYGRYVRINVTSATGSGSIATKLYGYKGLSAQGGAGNGGGSGGGMTVAGTANQITVSGTCNDTAGTCTVKLPNANVTIDPTTGAIGTPSSLSAGVSSGKSGAVFETGATDGLSQGFTVNDTAGTSILYVMPSAAGAATQVLTDNGATTCPTLASGAPALCHQLSWGTGGTGGSGGTGATFFSTTASTTVTAASATTLIGAVTGSTTIPANTFGAGSVLEFAAQGFYTSTGARTLNIQLFVAGSSQIATGAVTVPGATNGTWQLRCLITTRTTGVSGSQIANCMFLTTGATATAPGDFPMQTAATWAVDTTGTIALDLKAAWDATTGSPTITATNVAAFMNGTPGNSSGTFAGRPAAGHAGAIYWCTDCDYLFIDNGSTWLAKNGDQPVTLPPTVAGGTWTQFGTPNAFSDSAGSIYLQGKTTSANFQGATQTLNTGNPVVIKLDPAPVGNANCGLNISDGTKFTVMQIEVTGSVQHLDVVNYNTNSSFNAKPLDTVFTRVAGPMWLKVVITGGTTATWSWSVDGRNFQSLGATTFLTPTVAGISCLGDGTSNPSTTLLSWTN